jgi:hypothetical protein
VRAMAALRCCEGERADASFTRVCVARASGGKRERAAAKQREGEQGERARVGIEGAEAQRDFCVRGGVLSGWARVG